MWVADSDTNCSGHGRVGGIQQKIYEKYLDEQNGQYQSPCGLDPCMDNTELFGSWSRYMNWKAWDDEMKIRMMEQVLCDTQIQDCRCSP